MGEVVAVLTRKGAGRIIDDGGSQSWSANLARLSNCEYLVCARHRHSPHGPAEGPERHKHAFLVGRVKGIAESSETKGRWRIECAQVAFVEGPMIAFPSANPVRYFPSLSYMAIDERALEWHDVGGPRVEKVLPANVFDEAKALISARLGVPVEAVEIHVRA